VARLAKEHGSLLEFRYLPALAPKMTVAEFSARVASAFLPWPKELLESELDRKALVSPVQHDLFDGNPDGWKAYVAHLQKKVKWFATGLRLPERKSGTREEPAQAVVEDASPTEMSVVAAPSVEWVPPDEKKGWPWPQPGSASYGDIVQDI
jgi:hypothetical protein